MISLKVRTNTYFQRHISATRSYHEILMRVHNNSICRCEAFKAINSTTRNSFLLNRREMRIVSNDAVPASLQRIERTY